MLYGLLITVYLIICFFLAILILIQKGKSNMGIGAFGGSSQMLFGGSGGQDIFQKTTWVLGALFMAGSMCLAIMKTGHSKRFKYALAQENRMAQMATRPEESAEQPSAEQEAPESDTTQAGN
jgi:preprotein translocase subunit SecG